MLNFEEFSQPIGWLKINKTSCDFMKTYCISGILS